MIGRELRRKTVLLAVSVFMLGAPACGRGGTDTNALTLYAGREEYVGPLLKRFTSLTGIKIDARFGDSPELAAALLDEAANSKADVFLPQDAGSLGAVAKAGLFKKLPATLLERVPPEFRSDEGVWAGVAARVRTAVYNPARTPESALPDTIEGFIDPKWRGKIGWSPVNGSFQSFVTGFRLLRGEDATRKWLKGIKANRPHAYPDNSSIVKAVSSGEIDVGFANHYYIYELGQEDPSLQAANHFFKAGDPGNLVNTAGAGILKSSKNQRAAGRFLDFLLSARAQSYVATEGFEYPVVKGIPADPRLPTLGQIAPPKLDLSNLAELKKTQDLLRQTGNL